MKIFITGGAGYVGYSLINQLFSLYPEVEITVYDNLSRKNYALFLHPEIPAKRLKFVQGELLDSRKISKILPGHDIVIHLAAKVTTPFADHDAHSFEQINHWGTAELVANVENTPDVKRFVYLSSLSVYGAQDEPISVETEPNPHSFYGISKLRGERQVLRLADKKEVVIVRSGNVYGFNPAFRIDAVINRFMFEANYNGKISVHGSGEQHRSFIHIDKLANLLGRFVDKSMETGVFDFAEHNFSIQDIIDNIRLIYPELETLYVNQNIRMRDVNIALPVALSKQIAIPSKSFQVELQEFRKAFAF